MNTVEIANRRKLLYLVGKRAFAPCSSSLAWRTSLRRLQLEDYGIVFAFDLLLVLMREVREINIGILLLVPTY